MDKQLTIIDIPYALDWRGEVGIEKLEKDVKSIKKMGATFIEIDTYINHDCVELTIMPYKEINRKKTMFKFGNTSDRRSFEKEMHKLNSIINQDCTQDNRVIELIEWYKNECSKTPEIYKGDEVVIKAIKDAAATGLTLTISLMEAYRVLKMNLDAASKSHIKLQESEDKQLVDSHICKICNKSPISKDAIGLCNKCIVNAYYSK